MFILYKKRQFYSHLSSFIIFSYPLSYFNQCSTNPKKNKKSNNSKKNSISNSIKAIDNSPPSSPTSKPPRTKTNKIIKKKAHFSATSKIKMDKQSKYSNNSNPTFMSNTNKDLTNKYTLIWIKKYPKSNLSNSLKNLISKKSITYQEEKNLTSNSILEPSKTSIMQKRHLNN